METSSVPSYKYDVGISFLTQDLPVAQQLYDTLSPNLKVLLYTECQDVLAAVEGLSAFRTAFKSECQVVVVLYRKEWGETPWTAVEQQAIKVRLLNTGGHWRWLVFVMLNVADPVPDWMHDTYIKYDYERYGPEAACRAGTATPVFTTADIALHAADRLGDERRELQGALGFLVFYELEVGASPCH